ncbi:MAG: hypothetical protein HZA28_04425 [Candidatus Omnitrophica bacterium]|nr:hypothetical protein [Candidatus Omnitrophota bacterium]
MIQKRKRIFAAVKSFLIILFFSKVLYATVIESPEPELVAQWANFSRPVTLEAKEIKDGDYMKWGKPIWIFSYRAPKDSLTSYIIAVYEKGTLFQENREKMIKAIEDQVQSGKINNFREMIHIDERVDGRRVYFAIMGLGPGGVIFGAFTFFADFDLLVTEAQGHEKEIEDPAIPKNDLNIVYMKVERYALDQLKAESVEE